MKIDFTIHGNQEDATGNPIPYVRSTRGALWRPDGKRYAAWKKIVRLVFYNTLILKKIPIQAVGRIDAVGIDERIKPIKIKTGIRMDIKIYWKNGAHGDPDNIWKGIADALFVQDRNLDGSFESRISEDGKGRVEVSIAIDDKTSTIPC